MLCYQMEFKFVHFVDVGKKNLDTYRNTIRLCPFCHISYKFMELSQKLTHCVAKCFGPHLGFYLILQVSHFATSWQHSLRGFLEHNHCAIRCISLPKKCTLSTIHKTLLLQIPILNEEP
jgi:hypothetical protein